jgi:hypothetical protein
VKQGKSLSALAVEIERQSNAKRDFVAATRSLEMLVEDGAARWRSLGSARSGSMATRAASSRRISIFRNGIMTDGGGSSGAPGSERQPVDGQGRCKDAAHGAYS